MNVIHATRFGDPTVLQLAEYPDPAPAPGQIAVNVSHSAVGLVDVFLRQGLFKDAPGMPQAPFVPGLEVAGTVRALGEGVTGFRVGESVVCMSSGSGTGGYASVFVSDAARAISLEGTGIRPELAVSVVPNAGMAHVALTRVARLSEGESVLIHGALGGFASAFAGIAKTLGAARVVGTVRTQKRGAAQATKLPYDAIVESGDLATAIGDERFDVVIDPVGGAARDQSLELMRPGGRLLVVGNASEDWTHALKSNDVWLRNLTVSGFNAGAYLMTFPELVQPSLQAALRAVAAGLGELHVDVLPLAAAAAAHARMESRAVEGRLVLAH